jgi:hypothetical protein
MKENFFSETHKESIRKQRFILDITTTQTFSKMTVQDKITSLAKLIFLFQNDHGHSPKLLEKKLIRLNGDLKKQIVKDWSGIYSTQN